MHVFVKSCILFPEFHEVRTFVGTWYFGRSCWCLRGLLLPSSWVHWNVGLFWSIFWPHVICLQVGECVAIWWRPNFETIMYPYCPPHITKPKVTRVLCLCGSFLSFFLHIAGRLCLSISFSNLCNAGMQETLPCSLIWKRVLCSAKKSEIARCAIVWALW